MADLTNLERIAIEGTNRELQEEINKMGEYNKLELNRPMMWILDGLVGGFVTDPEVLTDEWSKINTLIDEGIDLNSVVDENSLTFYVLTIDSHYVYDMVQLFHDNGALFSNVICRNDGINTIDDLLEVDLAEIMDEINGDGSDEYKERMKQQLSDTQKVKDFIEKLN